MYALLTFSIYVLYSLRVQRACSELHVQRDPWSHAIYLILISTCIYVCLAYILYLCFVQSASATGTPWAAHTTRPLTSYYTSTSSLYHMLILNCTCMSPAYTYVNTCTILSQFAVCECNGHALSCTYNATLDHGVCDNCTDSTMGHFCELCVPGFYINGSLPLADPDICIGEWLDRWTF